jgi:protease-4
MRYARLISKLYAEPLLLEPAAWHAFDHAFRNLMSGGMSSSRPINLPARLHDDNPDLDGSDDDEPSDAPAARHDRILELRSDITGAPTTAIIYIDGVLDKHVAMMDLICYGGCDLDDVDAALNQVANDNQIRNVLLVFNTPGGSVIGVPETAAKVAELARIKNVKSFSDSKCCSGGIYIASQASEFFVTESAYTGSIGVISGPFLDFSKALEKEGITATTIKSGKWKDTGSPVRPMTDDEKAMLQARSDKIMAMFTGAVKRGRPAMSKDAMQGQTFFGAEAVEVRLADAVLPDLNAALAQF